MFFNDMVKSGYFMYMAEANGYDGLVSTRAAKINAVIRDFKSLVRQGKNPNDFIDEVLELHGIDGDSLTDAEVKKINWECRAR